MPTRREVLRLGALSVFGTMTASSHASGTVQPSRKCIFIMLQGGPSHIDMWDPKPEAAAEVRGPFGVASTRTPGLMLTDLSPETARVSEHVMVVRSMTHRFNNHIAGTYIMLTGSDDQPDADREAKADDVPGPGAILNYLAGAGSPVPVAISLPTWLSIPGPSNRMPGQYAGFLGSSHDPFLIQGEPQKPDFRPLSLTLPDDVSARRFTSREALLAGVDRATRQAETAAAATRDRLYESAFGLLTNPRFRDALDLSKESPAVRERYGMTKIGQSLLLARRLIEAGVTLVGFNEFNQHWDTHGAIENSLKDRVPPMDRAFAALVSDLADRGLLDETLVINTGEFGRTPVINNQAGRDHWPDVYSLLLAGGGIRGGAVWGRSDQRGAYVHSDPVTPSDLLATMWHCLGIPPETEIRDRLNRPHRLTQGRVMNEWLA
ncbi:DUF1501 domain-containing protein [Maioricimonas sp. JC845]|uniref:DUF1501 domain-containing protein n=1 Tax=Maioricimonas sp. JC845 TaxID=3232138 RepID=UPI00345784F6